MTQSPDLEEAEADFDPDNPQPIAQPNPFTLVTDRINLWATYLGGVVSIIAFLVIGVLLLVAVILRFAFNTSLGFAVEIPAFAFPWLIAGGVVAAMGRGGHLAVDYFANKLSDRNRRYLDILVWAVSTLTLGFLVYISTLMIRPYMGQSSPILGLPMMISFGAYIYMAVSLTVQSAARLFAAFRGNVPHPKGIVNV